jgi:hypothetical protein
MRLACRIVDKGTVTLKWHPLGYSVAGGGLCCSSQLEVGREGGHEAYHWGVAPAGNSSWKTCFITAICPVIDYKKKFLASKRTIEACTLRRILQADKCIGRCDFALKWARGWWLTGPGP